jgi:hypothetical protein
METIDVYHLTPQWTDTPMVDTRPLVAKIQSRAAHGGGGLELVLVIETDDNRRPILGFPIGEGPAVYDGLPEKGKMVRWGLRKLGPTVWMVQPSIVVPGALHAFVTIVEVPEPAPWTVSLPAPADPSFVPSDA